MINKFLKWVSIILKNSYDKASQISVRDNLKIHPSAIIENAYIAGDIEIKEGVTLTKGVYITGNVTINNYTSISGPNTDIYSALNKILIGKFCSIARNVSFQEYYHHSDRLSTFMINYKFFNSDNLTDLTSKGDIVIGNDVWIGMHSVILSGVKIGNGVIIGANSVVNSDIPDYAIAAGSPAKIVKYRFSQSTIDILNKVSWWDWSKDEIINNKHFFQASSEYEILELLKNINPQK